MEKSSADQTHEGSPVAHRKSEPDVLAPNQGDRKSEVSELLFALAPE